MGVIPLRVGDFGKLGELDIGAAQEHADPLV
jgi:hypothetical protein